MKEPNTMATKPKKSPKEIKEDLKKAVAQYNRKVARDNKAFDALSPAEKRVFIARDVLAQLAAKKIVAETGTWVSAANSEQAVISEQAMAKDKELKEVFDSMKSCNACALGGLFVCAVKINDRLKISEMEHVKTGRSSDDEDGVDIPRNDSTFRAIYLNDIEKYLGRFFSKNQLKLIELAFEAGDGGYDADNDDDEEAVSFFSDLEDSLEEDTIESSYGYTVSVSPHNRMVLIMQNIVANKGKFVPYKRPVATLSFSMPGFEG